MPLTYSVLRMKTACSLLHNQEAIFLYTKICKLYYGEEEIKTRKGEEMRTLSIGDQVDHKLFGRGIVLAVEGHEASAKLTIEFGKNISKVIIAKYIKLVKK